jgi:hypothetical protein
MRVLNDNNQWVGNGQIVDAEPRVWDRRYGPHPSEKEWDEIQRMSEKFVEEVKTELFLRRKTMSWSASFLTPVRKIDAAAYIDRLSTGTQMEGPAIDQCELAKSAAKSLLAGIPGPYVHVSLSGHANGVGWQKKEGYANDCINISITQIIEPPL